MLPGWVAPLNTFVWIDWEWFVMVQGWVASVSNVSQIHLQWFVGVSVWLLPDRGDRGLSYTLGIQYLLFIWGRQDSPRFTTVKLAVWRCLQWQRHFTRKWRFFDEKCDFQLFSVFRWFKFTLKPPYSIARGNYDWPFGTLPFGLFGSNLDTRDLETYPRTYSGHFWNMSIFDNSRAVWVLLRKWVVSENQSFLDEGAIVTPLISLVLGGQVPRLNHGPIWFPIQNT